MFIPVRSGLCQSDSINRLIQLTVIQLSGGHCICSQKYLKMLWKRKNVSVNAHYGIQVIPSAFNFTNIFRTRFSYELLFLVTFKLEKDVRTKNACKKCWWNWPLTKNLIITQKNICCHVVNCNSLWWAKCPYSQTCVATINYTVNR